MFKQVRLRTILLGMLVIIVTSSVFIALPALVPSLGQMDCDKVIWACGRRPIVYETLIWDKSEPPETAARPGKVNVVPDADNSHLIISGYLLYGYYETENISGTSLPVFIWKGGLPDRTILVEYARVYEKKRNPADTYEVRTDSNGFFSLEVDIDDEMICYFLEAFKDYEVLSPRSKDRPIEIYMDSKALYVTCEGSEITRRGIPWWVWLILAIAIIAGGWLIYRYLKRRKKIEIPPDMLPPAEEFEISVKEEAEEPESGGDTSRMSISFPGIEESLPAVWGVGEPLAVNINLKDDDVLSSQACEVEWGDDVTIRLVSDENGNVNSVHVFTGKGEYIINASYKDDATRGSISSWRKIRIVDYREEMVRLFNELLKKLDLTDISISSEMTPREIEEILKPRLEGIDETALRRLISGFEEANYSTHPVTRDSYLNLYRSVNEVLGYGR